MEQLNWQKVYSVNQRYLAEIIKGVLAEHHIECLILDKKDSAYGFGEVEVYTIKDNVVKALHIIQKYDL